MDSGFIREGNRREGTERKTRLFVLPIFASLFTPPRSLRIFVRGWQSNVKESFSSLLAFDEKEARG